MDIQALWQRVKKFLKYVWQECKDKKTIALLLVVVLVMYMPAWGGYLVHALFGWKWGSVVASAYILFWAGPCTPFWPLCIAITLFIKRMIKKRMGKDAQKGNGAESKSEVDVDCGAQGGTEDDSDAATIGRLEGDVTTDTTGSTEDDDAASVRNTAGDKLEKKVDG
jgi:hypothetical protein